MLKLCFALFISAILQISNAQTNAIVTGTPTISIVPGCASCHSSKAISATQTDGPSSTSSPNSMSTHENKVIIIASSVSAGGLLVIVSFLICCLYRRKQKRAMLNSRARNIPRVQAVLDEKEVLSSLNNEAVKKYNVNKELNNNQAEEEEEEEEKSSLPTPPVILYSDILKNNEEPKKKDSIDFTSRTSVVSNGTRLSKYNFLAQAFSQMRESYAGGPTHKLHDDMEAMPKPTPLHTKDSNRTFHDSMVLTKYDFEDAKRPLSIPETIESVKSGQHSTTTDIRESTMTVATLHAPLFKNSGFHHHPMPSRSNTPLLYQSAMANNNYRDSVVSDVSQFTTWPTNRSMDDEETGTLHRPIKL